MRRFVDDEPAGYAQSPALVARDPLRGDEDMTTKGDCTDFKCASQPACDTPVMKRDWRKLLHFKTKSLGHECFDQLMRFRRETHIKAVASNKG